MYWRTQGLIACIAYLGHMIVGLTMGWSAPVIPKLQDAEQTPLPYPLTDEESSWIGSLLYVGTIIGPYLGSFISNQFGRKPAFFCAGIVTALSFVMMAFAKNLATIYTARMIMGFGPGIIFVMNFVYIGEIASTNIRGILLTIISCTGTIGTLLIYSVGPYVSFAGTCWFGFGMCAAFIVSCFFLPESPVFQMLKGQEEKARETLQLLGRGDEIEKVKTVAFEDKVKPKKIDEWIEIVTIKPNRKALFITLTLCVIQQMSGVVPVTFFATTIFELASSSIEPNIATIIIGVTQLFASALTPFFVERAGRKSLLLVSCSFTSLSLFVLALYFYLDRIDHVWIPSLGWLPLASLIACFLSYDFGYGIIPGTLIGEMFRPNVRSTGSSVTVTVAWAVGFGVSSAFGYMIPAIGPDYTFLFFACSTACAFLFSLFFVPETKGKTLLEIEEMLSK